jgi:FkbM family methyltransferase
MRSPDAMTVSAYRIKRTLLAPRTAYRRRKEREVDRFGRSMLELHAYGRAIYDFIGAKAAKPDILVDADVDDRSVVVDVGAYHGEWSEQVSQRYGSTVFAFEPDPTSFPRLVERLAKHRNTRALGYGLGGRDHEASLALAGPGSSIYGANDAFGAANVQIRDVASVLDELGVDRVDLIKVNIEGGEYDLFDRLIETSWLHRMRLVSVQFHEWHPKAHSRRRRIRRSLRATHEQVWNYPWVWEYWRRRPR